MATLNDQWVEAQTAICIGSLYKKMCSNNIVQFDCTWLCANGTHTEKNSI